MKRILLVVIATFAFGIGQLSAQTEGGMELPSIDVKSLDGENVNTGEFSNDGNPIIVSFWATWCKPCILELQTILDDYESLVEETGVKLIAISIDDARNKHKVKPFVNGREWPYEVYTDENGDFKRAMGVNNVPHTFVLDGNNNIVWQHNSYAPGDEIELYEIVEKVKAGTLESADQH